MGQSGFELPNFYGGEQVAATGSTGTAERTSAGDVERGAEITLDDFTTYFAQFGPAAELSLFCRNAKHASITARATASTTTAGNRGEVKLVTSSGGMQVQVEGHHMASLSTPTNHDALSQMMEPQSPSCTKVYEIVPEVYFNRDFKLENHDVFRQSIAKSFASQEETSARMQDYLAEVEEALFEQVREAHRLKLFETMIFSLAALMKQTEKMEARVKALRDRWSAYKGSYHVARRVGQLGCAKQRLQDLRRRIDLIFTVRESVPTMQMLIAGEDYVTALELLESTQSALSAQDMLRGVTCVRPVRDEVESLARNMDSTFADKFVAQA
ncbi:unnamed protein product, partial [Amoebophrya sp. A25]|eukprot:GSA25T00001987001.1